MSYTGNGIRLGHAIAPTGMRQALFVVASSDAMVFMLLRAHYERARSMTGAAGQKAGSSLRQEVYCIYRYGFCRGRKAAVHVLNKNEERYRWLAWRP